MHRVLIMFHGGLWHTRKWCFGNLVDRHQRHHVGLPFRAAAQTRCSWVQYSSSNGALSHPNMASRLYRLHIETLVFIRSSTDWSAGGRLACSDRILQPISLFLKGNHRSSLLGQVTGAIHSMATACPLLQLSYQNSSDSDHDDGTGRNQEVATPLSWTTSG